MKIDCSPDGGLKVLSMHKPELFMGVYSYDENEYSSCIGIKFMNHTFVFNGKTVKDNELDTLGIEILEDFKERLKEVGHILINMCSKRDLSFEFEPDLNVNGNRLGKCIFIDHSAVQRIIEFEVGIKDFKNLLLELSMEKEQLCDYHDLKMTGNKILVVHNENFDFTMNFGDFKSFECDLEASKFENKYCYKLKMNVNGYILQLIDHCEIDWTVPKVGCFLKDEEQKELEDVFEQGKEIVNKKFNVKIKNLYFAYDILDDKNDVELVFEDGRIFMNKLSMSELKDLYYALLTNVNV